MLFNKQNAAEQNQSARHGKLFWLYSQISKAGPDKAIDKTKLIAETCSALNTAWRTTSEYLRILEGTGKIRTEGKFVFLIKPEEKFEEPAEADAK